jgi:hypothetical protein
LETPLGNDNLDYCTHKVPWQLEHPDRSSCFAFSLLFRDFLFDCPDLPEFRASLLVVSSRPIAFSTLGGWPRAVFTKMPICAAVEASGKAFAGFPLEKASMCSSSSLSLQVVELKRFLLSASFEIGPILLHHRIRRGWFAD